MSEQTPSGGAGGDGGGPTTATSNAEAHATTATTTAAEKPSRKRPFSRLVSWLCCGAGAEQTNEAGADGPRPSSKKANQVQSIGARKVVVTEKPGGAAAPEGSSDAKEAVDENARDSEKTEFGGDAPTPQQGSLQTMPQASTSALSEETETGHVAGDGAPGSYEGTQPEPPLERVMPPAEAPLSSRPEGLRVDPPPQTTEVRVIIQAPTPVLSQTDPIPSPVEPTAPMAAPVVDEDVEMTDAPSTPARGEEERPQEPISEKEVPDKTELPGPPPAESRVVAAQTRPVEQAQESRQEPAPEALSSAEPQQWLLPPRETRFSGRKCLVLDLDETLVHSSFKVCHGCLPDWLE